MSRNTQHEFVSASNAESIVESLTSIYELITKTSVRPSSPEKLFLEWVAYIILLERGHINSAGNSNLPSRAEGDDLDTLGRDIYNIERPAPTPSTVTMRFYISEAQSTNVLIPRGTRVTEDTQTLFWKTDEDVYITAGNTYADVSCTCETAGLIGNYYSVGLIKNLVDLFDYYDHCENITISDGGSDSPDDEEFYQLLVQSMDAWSTAGPKGGYIYFAKQVSSEIADVIAKQPTPGTVAIYALMKDGTIASSEIKQKILEACSEDYKRPLTDHVTVEDPSTVSYNISLTYYTAYGTAKSQSEMLADVQKAVSDYIKWQQSKIGRDINPDKLREFVLAAGVKRMVITEPVFTHLIDGTEENTDIPQVAAIGNTTILDGGYEDE